MEDDIKIHFFDAIIAIEDNKIEELKTEVESFPECIQMSNHSKGSLLHYAAYKGTPEMIEYLVGKGSDIDRIERSLSPLCFAIIKGKEENVKKLIELGANVDSKISESNPLNYAIINNNEKIAKLLIDAGIDLTTQFHPRSHEWWDALSHAKYCNCKKIYKMILKKMKKDGIDYDSIEPMPEEETMEEEIVLPDIYEKNLGKIAKIYDQTDLQKKIYDGRIRLISDLDEFDIAVIMPGEKRVNYM